MMGSIQILGLGAALYLCSAASAYAQSVADQVSFEEIWRDSVPVSGEVIVGVVAPPADSDTVSLANLHVQLPQSFTGEFCVRIANRDGRYRAQAVFNAPADGGGLVHTPLQSQYEADISAQEWFDIVAIAAPSETCQAPSTVFPVSWGQPASEGVSIVANSNLTTVVAMMRKPDGSAERIACAPISQEQSIAFDTVCTLPRRPAGEGLVRLRRASGGTLLPDIDISIPN